MESTDTNNRNATRDKTLFDYIYDTIEIVQWVLFIGTILYIIIDECTAHFGH